jgi:mannosyltransferase
MLNETDLDEPRSAAPATLWDTTTDRILIALTAAAVLAGLVLRFLPRSGMWLDEALTVNISTLPLGEMPGALRRDGHPPLFYVLLHFWERLGGGADWWLRALPGVLSAATLPVIHAAGRRIGARADSVTGAGPLGARRTGLLALAVLSLMPFAVRYGAEVRMYSLVMLLVSLGYLLVDDLLTGRRGETWRAVTPSAAGAALVAAALLWSHYWSLWLLAGVGLLALWRAWREPAGGRRTGARALVVSLVAGGLLFLPWVPTLLYQSANTGTPWGIRFGPASVVVVSLIDFAGARFGVAALLSYLLVGLIALAAIVMIDPAGRLVITGRIQQRVRPELWVIASTLGIGWALSFASRNTYSSRYAAVVLPLFVLCVATGLAVLRSRNATALVLTAILVGGAWGSVSTVRFERSQTDSVVERIGEDLAGREGGAVIVACPDQLGVATHRQAGRLLGESVEVLAYPTATDPRFVDWVDYGIRNAAADPAEFADAIHRRIPAGTTVYLVAGFTYRTFEGQCERLVNELAGRGAMEKLSEADPDRHDEIATLWAFRPPG